MLKRKSFIFLMICIMIIGLAVPAFADVSPVVAQKIYMESTMDSKFPVSSEPLPEMKVSKEEALEIAQKALKDLFGMSVADKKYNFNVENRKDWSNPKLYVWQMNWNYNDAAEYAYANVVLNAMTGDILEIGKDGGSYGEITSKLTTLTKEEAKKKVEDFIGKIIPGLLNQTVWNDNSDDYYRIMYGGPSPMYYYFNYVRLYNGVKYDNNYINVGIDGASGEIRNFNYRWDDLKDVPAKTGVISAEEATKILKDNTIMELIYLPIRDQYRYESVPKNVKLAYRASYNNANMIDAKTGKMISWNGKEQDQSMKAGSLTDKQINDILAKAKSVVKKDKEISKERAQELAQMILKEEVEGTVKINNVNYVEGDGYWEAAGRKAWNIDFTVERKSENTDGKGEILPMMNGRVMIDALTEEVLAFNNWDYYGMPYGQGFEPAMTWEEAYGKAMEYIAKYHPGKINQIKTDQTYVIYNEVVDGKEIPPMELYFNFARKINGVVYDENSINISFNNRTGKLQNFTCRWQEGVNFPTPQNAIGQNQAKDILMKFNTVELAYTNFNKTNDYQNPQFETKLIYRLFPKKPQYNMSMMLDAISGKPIDYNGKELPSLEVGEFDSLISNHWVERTAKLLAQQGIVEPAGFKPDEAITKMDVVKMMVKARGMDYNYPMALKEEAQDKTNFSDVKEDSDDYRYIQQAIRFGIIDNKDGAFNGSAKVTREQLAVMMVKALKYDALAKAPGIFKLDYADQASISSDLIGFVAISKGLGLVRVGQDNNFRPKANATMAETADMVYKSMAHMSRTYYY